MDQPIKKKKRALTRRGRVALIIALLLALGGGTALYLFARQPVTTPVPDREMTFETLKSFDETQVQRIAITLRDGESYALVQKDGTLVMEGNDSYQVDDSIASAMLSAAATITIEDIVTEDYAAFGDTLADFGLDLPYVTVTVDYATGEACTLLVGDAAPDTTDRYFMLDGDRALYLTYRGMADVFGMEKALLHSVEQLSLQKERIDHITVTDGDGSVMAELVQDSSVSDAERLYRWRITAPLEYPAEGDKVNSLLTNIGSLLLGTYVGEANDETLAQYGFSPCLATLTVHFASARGSTVDSEGVYHSLSYPEQTFVMSIGGSESEYIDYVLYNGEIFRTSHFLLTFISDIKPADMALLQPGYIPFDSLAGLDVTSQAGTISYVVSREENVLENNELETDAEGNTVYTTTVTRNGEAYASEQFQTQLETFGAITVGGSLPAGFAPKGEPHTTFTLTLTDGAVRTIALYDFDALHDAIAVDGVCLHYLIKGGMGLGVFE